MNKGIKRAKIKKGDHVIVTTGKDYNKFNPKTNERTPIRGRVLEVSPSKGKVKVEGAGIVKKHRRANQMANRPGGIIEMENWIDISNVQLIDPETGKPTRVRYEVSVDSDGKRVKTRVAAGSKRSLDQK